MPCHRQQQLSSEAKLAWLWALSHSLLPESSPSAKHSPTDGIVVELVSLLNSEEEAQMRPSQVFSQVPLDELGALGG